MTNTGECWWEMVSAGVISWWTLVRNGEWGVLTSLPAIPNTYLFMLKRSRDETRGWEPLKSSPPVGRAEIKDEPVIRHEQTRTSSRSYPHSSEIRPYPSLLPFLRYYNCQRDGPRDWIDMFHLGQHEQHTLWLNLFSKNFGVAYPEDSSKGYMQYIYILKLKCQ